MSNNALLEVRFCPVSLSYSKVKFFQGCGEGEHIYVDLETRQWECVNETDSVCPGSVEFFCPDQSIPTGEPSLSIKYVKCLIVRDIGISEVDQVKCGCDWQVHVGEDCTEAVLCHSAYVALYSNL